MLFSLSGNTSKATVKPHPNPAPIMNQFTTWTTTNAHTKQKKKEAQSRTHSPTKIVPIATNHEKAPQSKTQRKNLKGNKTRVKQVPIQEQLLNQFISQFCRRGGIKTEPGRVG